jgi:hypothetical protein
MGDIKKVLITDLDNTLFDWVALWCACFTAMMNKVVEISGIPVEDLKPEIRRVHQRHGTSEYSFLLEGTSLFVQEAWSQKNYSGFCAGNRCVSSYASSPVSSLSNSRGNIVKDQRKRHHHCWIHGVDGVLFELQS